MKLDFLAMNLMKLYGAVENLKCRIFLPNSSLMLLRYKTTYSAGRALYRKSTICKSSISRE